MEIHFLRVLFFLDEGETLSLVYENQGIYGFGVEPIPSYNPEKAFEKACEEALRDLNSNQFLSVYIEEFKSHEYSTYNFPELSVRDTLLVIGENVAKTDSFAIQGKAFCVLSGMPSSPSITDAMPSLEKLMIGPRKVGGIWYAIGKARATRYNPTISWMKSKNNAVKELTKVIQLSVQSLSRQLEEGARTQTAEITYFKSKVIYEGIYTIRRYRSNKSFVTVIAVPENSVFRF